jgi:hypothetical protein
VIKELSAGLLRRVSICSQINQLGCNHLPLSILNQPQKTSRTGCVGWIGDNFLPEQRIAYVSHVNQELVDDIVRQPITEAVD